MLFSDPSFTFFFFPIALLIWLAVAQFRNLNLTLSALILLSLIFYVWDNSFNLLILAWTIIISFATGHLVSDTSIKNRRFILVASLGILLINLAIFKYYYFLTGAHINLTLPLAISFYTFQQIAYLVDSYRNLNAEKNFLRYCFAIAFFPQLIAGPIVRYDEIRHQLDKLVTPFSNHKNLSRGFILIIIGLAKKVLLADNLALFVDSYYNGTFGIVGSHGAQISLFISLCFYLQIYFDFSGYCDIALGLAKLFNLNFPVNFRAPYRAQTISDFWRKWHITLSRFLRDYLYISMGGNRHGMLWTAFCLSVTMLLGGLWHGAGWLFVAWGAMHGFALIIYHIWAKQLTRLPSVLAWILTQTVVFFSWIFFRAADTTQLSSLLSSLADWRSYESLQFNQLSIFFIDKSHLPYITEISDYFGITVTIMAFMFLSTFCAYLPINSKKLLYLQKTKPALAIAYFLSLAALICLTLTNVLQSSEATQPFIYFQF